MHKAQVLAAFYKFTTKNETFRNKTKPPNIEKLIYFASKGYPSAIQSSASQLRDVIQVRFNLFNISSI